MVVLAQATNNSEGPVVGLLDRIGRLFRKEEDVSSTLGRQWISEELEHSLSRKIVSTLREQRGNGTPNGLYEIMCRACGLRSNPESVA